MKGIVFLSLILFSCSPSKFTIGQLQKYNNSKNIICDEQIDKSMFQKVVTTNDSLLNFYRDICDFNLDELTEKYKIKKEKVDTLLLTICISSEIKTVYKNLNSKLEKLNSTVDLSLINADEAIKRFENSGINLEKLDTTGYYFKRQ